MAQLTSPHSTLPARSGTMPLPKPAGRTSHALQPSPVDRLHHVLPLLRELGSHGRRLGRAEPRDRLPLGHALRRRFPPLDKRHLRGLQKGQGRQGGVELPIAARRARLRPDRPAPLIGRAWRTGRRVCECVCVWGGGVRGPCLFLPKPLAPQQPPVQGSGRNTLRQQQRTASAGQKRADQH